jgi:hypothetical protein
MTSIPIFYAKWQSCRYINVFLLLMMLWAPKYYTQIACSAAPVVACTVRFFRCWITGGSKMFLFMLLICCILIWFDHNCNAFTATLWCLRTTYAYKWSVGVDSGSRDISISKISACSCKLDRSVAAEILWCS